MSDRSAPSPARGPVLWAHTALRPRLGRLDARAVFPVMAWLLHWSWLTFFLALTGVCFLALLDWTGLPPEAALARFRTILVGRVRPAAEVITLRRRAHW